MEEEIFNRLRKLIGHELEPAEKERLQRIQDILNIGPNDALWSIIAALEYQRVYYEELPEKIRRNTGKMLSDFASQLQEKTAASSPLINESNVANGGQSDAMKKMLSQSVILVIVAFCLAIVYGSIAMWAGYSLACGQIQPPRMILQMSGGIVIGILCLGASFFEAYRAAYYFCKGDKYWHKYAIVSVGLFVPGALSLTLGL